MIRFMTTVVVVATVSGSAWAQTTTATGTGVGVAKSTSKSAAVAVSGQGGAGGSSSSTLNINNPASISSRTEVSGTQTLKNVPTALAPSLAAAGIETCLGSVSGGASVVGFGGSFGGTIPDPGCNARLDARSLWNMGLKSAAVARLCLSPDIYRSMPDVCARYMPAAPGVAPVVVASAGGPVEVIVQKTGEHRMCRTYDESRQRCRAWAR